ncbi:MAG: ABC transporter ATP-binding protein [Erysipelotrichales bacterium]|nr:ABC transporter ATP-binding protein [Erysipelotrichales bacterium]
MIEVKNLVKDYGSVVAVDDISFVAENGRISVLLGPNGAGKSTTIKSIAGLLTHDGDILIDGHENTSIEAKKSFGYIPEVPIFYENLTVEEHIKFIGKAYKLDNYMEYADYLLEKFNLSDKKKTVAKKLSKGMTQKLSMILGLMTKPTSMMMDEPMIGLDPQAIEEVLVLLKDLKESGISILISTHIIDVINDLWDDAYIMNKGKIVRVVRREELKEDESLKDIFFECVGE